MPKAPQPPATLLLSQSWYRPVEARHPFRRTMPLDRISREPLQVVARWLDLSIRVERLLSLFLAALEASNVETRFLFLIQALEGLHRALDDRPGIPATHFDKGVAALNRALPPDIPRESREFLRQRLPQHNQPSLAVRLREYGERVTGVIPGALPKFSKDRRGIKMLRDEFSHALPTRPPASVEAHGRRLLYYSEVLRILFEFNLLHHLEIDPDRLRDAFGATGAFEKLARERGELLGNAG